MTPSEIDALCKTRYNATGDNFFPSTMVYDLIFQASMELAVKAKLIESIYTTSTVASQQAYAYPTQTMMIKRVTYAGTKLIPINMREDDALTTFNQSTTETGTPAHYFIWSNNIYLRPIPAAVGTLKIFSINKPQSISSTSVLEVPEEFHFAICDFILAHMFAKDQNLNMFKYYMDRWDSQVIEARRWQINRRRQDGYSTVMNEEALPASMIGSF